MLTYRIISEVWIFNVASIIILVHTSTVVHSMASISSSQLTSPDTVLQPSRNIRPIMSSSRFDPCEDRCWYSPRSSRPLDWQRAMFL